MPVPSVEGELLVRSLNEELHDVVAPTDLAASVVERHRAGRRRRRVVLGPLVASLAAVAVVFAVVLPTVNRAAPAPRWTLVGDVSPLWHETPSQGLTQSLFLTCPTATTCYVPGPGGLEATRDAGKTWSVVAGTPTTLSPPPSNVTCVSVSTCAVVSWSSSNGRALFMETVDAGKTWVRRPAPSWLSSLYPPGTTSFGPVSLSCSTAATCSVVASNSSGTLVGAFVTSNGGRSWSASSLPSGSSYAALRCFPSGQCILAGQYGAAYSTDGGRTWSSGTGYSGPGTPALLSCSNALDCMVMGIGNPAGAAAPWAAVTNDGGRRWSTAKGVGLPTGDAFGLSCSTGSDCWASAGGPRLLYIPPRSWPGAVIVSTTNGGATWQRDALPQGVGNVQGVSCPSSNTCFALAWSQQTVVLLAYQS
jgi:photosystem II stability/assembly factor-like uncharacterized protein